jgi:ligand-binding sensor domain-containing protein
MVVAGTNQGIFVLDPPSGGNFAGSALGSGLIWERRDMIANTVMKTAVEIHYGTRVNVERQVHEPPFPLQSRVNSLDVSGDVWLAGTNNGLLTSGDEGLSWHGGPVMGEDDFTSVSAHGKVLAAAWANGIVLSQDDGQTWWPMGTPKMLARVHCIAFSPDGTLWVGAREGVYLTRNLGKSWLWFKRLPFRDVDDLYYDPVSHRVLVSSRESDQVFGIDPKTLTWKWWQTGYDVALIRPAGDRLVAASVGDGVLVEPPAPGTESAQQ